MIINFSPGLIMMIGGLLLPLLPRSTRILAVLLLPLLTAYAAWNIPEGTDIVSHFAGLLLHPVYYHPYSLIFATVFCIAAFIGGVFALKTVSRPLELSAAYLYAGSAVSAVYSGDLVSLFIFWEIMAVGSTAVVLCGATSGARQAAFRYAIMHFFGGVLLLAGIAAYITYAKDIMITPLSFNFANLYDLMSGDLGTIAKLLMLLGILINAGAPPLGAWLPDAYPESSPTGGVFLSAFTTKTSVFVLLTLFPGSDILLWIGLIMVFYGIIMGAITNDLRGMLSYSIINQVGFMVAGIGIGTEMALLGAAAHAFCHIIYKCALFMSAGSVIQATGIRKTTELGGLYHTMKITAFCGFIGAISISAFPFTSGFISKALYVEGAIEANMAMVWLLLLAGSVGVAALTGCKYMWFVFFQEDSGLRPKEAPLNMKLAMLLVSALCILPGFMPQAVYMLLPVGIDYNPNTTDHIINQIELLLGGCVAFFVLLALQKRTDTIVLDFDWLWRKFAGGLIMLSEQLIYFTAGAAAKAAKIVLGKAKDKIYEVSGPNAAISRNWALGTTVLVSVLMLGILLVIYYIGK